MPLPNIKVEYAYGQPKVYVNGNLVEGVIEVDVYPDRDHTRVKITIATQNLKIENVKQDSQK